MATINSFSPSDAVRQDCETRDRRCAHAVGKEDINVALDLFKQDKHWFPDISRGSCRTCQKNQCTHSTSFFNSTDNSKRRVSTHLFWKCYLGPSSLVTDSLLKASWSRLDSCDCGIRGNGQAKQGAGAKICINPYHYAVPPEDDDLLPALEIYCQEIGLSLNIPSQRDARSDVVLRLIREAFGNTAHDPEVFDTMRRLGSVSMDSPSAAFNFQGLPFHSEQYGNRLVFSAQQHSSNQLANQLSPPLPMTRSHQDRSSVESSSVHASSNGFTTMPGSHRVSLSEDVDLNFNMGAGSTSYSPTTMSFWPSSPDMQSSTVLNGLNHITQPMTTEENLDNDVFHTPTSGGFFMAHLPLDTTSGRSSSTSRLESLSESGMDISDEEIGEFKNFGQKVAFGVGKNDSEAASVSCLPPTTSTTTTTPLFITTSYDHCLEHPVGSSSSDISPQASPRRSRRLSSSQAVVWA